MKGLKDWQDLMSQKPWLLLTAICIILSSISTVLLVMIGLLSLFIEGVKFMWTWGGLF